MTWADEHGAGIIVASAVVFAAIIIFLVVLTVRAHRNRVTTGFEGFTGARGVYRGGGLALIRGELWRVETDEELQPGDRLEVLGAEGLNLRVRKL